MCRLPKRPGKETARAETCDLTPGRPNKGKVLPNDTAADTGTTMAEKTARAEHLNSDSTLMEVQQIVLTRAEEESLIKICVVKRML